MWSWRIRMWWGVCLTLLCLNQITVLNGFESIQLKMTMQAFRSRDFANISLFWAFFLADIMRRGGLEWWFCWEASRDQDCLQRRLWPETHPKRRGCELTSPLLVPSVLGTTPPKRKWEPGTCTKITKNSMDGKASFQPKLPFLSIQNSHSFPSEIPICIDHP